MIRRSRMSLKSSREFRTIANEGANYKGMTVEGCEMSATVCCYLLLLCFHCPCVQSRVCTWSATVFCYLLSLSMSCSTIRLKSTSLPRSQSLPLEQAVASRGQEQAISDDFRMTGMLHACSLSADTYVEHRHRYKVMPAIHGGR